VGVYCRAAGFGKWSSVELVLINDGWDWSHVRDSTPDAFRAMAAHLGELGFGPDGPKPTRGPDLRCRSWTAFVDDRHGFLTNVAHGRRAQPLMETPTATGPPTGKLDPTDGSRSFPTSWP
jgi:hypothetical protein